MQFVLWNEIDQEIKNHSNFSLVTVYLAAVYQAVIISLQTRVFLIIRSTISINWI
jgi:hypothetical protein